jgi:hypothetical protein
MRVGVAIMLLVATPEISPAQFYRGSNNRLSTSRVVEPAQSLDTGRSVQPGYRGTWPGTRFDQLALRSRPYDGRQTWTPIYQSRRQAGYFHLPQYPEFRVSRANMPPRQALAPRPIYRHPLADPFYEERVLSDALGDSSGYYPPW